MARVSNPWDRVNPDSFSRKRVVRLPSDVETAIMNGSEVSRRAGIPGYDPDGRPGSYAMTDERAIGAASLMDLSHVSSPFMGMPFTGKAEFTEVLGDEYGMGGEWDDFWSEDQTGYDYANNAQEYGAAAVDPRLRGSTKGYDDRAPADINIVPTSTINPERPRTVAAGYDRERSVLTVVFRDGTFYNYYDVSASTWKNFKQTTSKGRFIAQYLDGHARGTANMSDTPVWAREAAYSIARSAQILSGPSDVTSKNYATGRTERRLGVSPKLQQDRSLPLRVNPTKSRPRTNNPPMPASKANKSANRPPRRKAG